MRTHTRQLTWTWARLSPVHLQSWSTLQTIHAVRLKILNLGALLRPNFQGPLGSAGSKVGVAPLQAAQWITEDH